LAFKKKLHAARPDESRPLFVETHRTCTKRRRERADSVSVENGVRQLLADKVSGALMGVWLLVPEHLRLGTWDLLCGWSGQPTPAIAPRLALQLVHESALCVTGVRQRRALSQKGFEVANGLPFIAADPAIHDLLDAHPIAHALSLQKALGRLRRASGHFRGRLLALDPHRMRSYSQRQMRRRQDKDGGTPRKMAQIFVCFDVETAQPIAFTTATASRTATDAACQLLDIVRDILHPDPAAPPLVLADTEHLSADLFDYVRNQTPFDLLVPVPRRAGPYRAIAALPSDSFTPHWAGFATTKRPYRLHNGAASLHQFLQRTGESPDHYAYKAFLCTRRRNEVDALTRDYPRRWHIEEFFNAHQALGWQRAGTLNLHIRYGQMTFALLAQTVVHQLRSRLGEPFQTWSAQHFADQLLSGLDGDLRVHDDTLLVTFYNAPHADRLRPLYEHLPARLVQEGVDPHIPWLFGFKLDFRFK